MCPLTFHFHDLIGVLDHLIFGFVAEGVGPGLDQVQDLVSDIWLCLHLKVKEPYNEIKSLNLLRLYSAFLLSHNVKTELNIIVLGD